MAQISSSLEDYIEAVYTIYNKEKKVKAIDVSRRLNVSRASVTEALQKLEQSGLINYGRYGTISITDEGVKKAKEVIKKLLDGKKADVVFAIPSYNANYEGNREMAIQTILDK